MTGWTERRRAGGPEHDPRDGTPRHLSQHLTIGAPNPILNPMLNDADADRAFHALGDPNRRWILTHLSRSPSSASRMAAPLGISMAAVVQHLQVLEESGLVRSEKEGRVRVCRLDPGGIRSIERWLSERRQLWERRLDRLGSVLDEDP
jgi:DNA-binding transcriptional ArsR family regulator